MSLDPIDPDSTDWVFFSYQNWLRAFEAITEHKALLQVELLLQIACLSGML